MRRNTRVQSNQEILEHVVGETLTFLYNPRFCLSVSFLHLYFQRLWTIPRANKKYHTYQFQIRFIYPSFWNYTKGSHFSVLRNFPSPCTISFLLQFLLAFFGTIMCRELSLFWLKSSKTRLFTYSCLVNDRWGFVDIFSDIFSFFANISRQRSEFPYFHFKWNLISL